MRNRKIRSASFFRGFSRTLCGCASAQVHGGDPGRRAPGVSGAPATDDLGVSASHGSGEGSAPCDLRYRASKNGFQDDAFMEAPSGWYFWGLSRKPLPHALATKVSCSDRSLFDARGRWLCEAGSE